MTKGVIHLDILLDAPAIGSRLDKALADAARDLSRERIKALLAEGAVRDAAGKVLSSGSAKVTAPMALTITLPEPRDPAAAPQDIALTVVYEDDDLIVVDKAAGMVVHPANGNPDGTLVNALLHHCAGRLSGLGGVARPGIVHRIDKDTSGLLVVAKNDKAHEGLALQFFHHSIERVYQCFTNGIPIPPAGKVDAPLGRSNHDRKKMAVVAEGHGKRAVTHFRVIQPFDRAALVECRLETGRTHQVRAHMAHIGHPLLGDGVYGRQGPHSALLRELGFQRQALHAAHLGFIHPVNGQHMAFDSEMPPDMQELFIKLRLKSS